MALLFGIIVTFVTNGSTLYTWEISSLISKHLETSIVDEKYNKQSGPWNISDFLYVDLVRKKTSNKIIGNTHFLTPNVQTLACTTREPHTWTCLDNESSKKSRSLREGFISNQSSF